jgi:hypothetical protein
MTSRLEFNPGRHIYKLDGHHVPSVTTLLRVLDKPAIPPWTARITAQYALDHWDDLAAMPSDERFELLRGTADRAKNKAAARGTQIHKWAEDLLKGAPVEIPPEHVATVEGFAAFWESAGMVTAYSECQVWTEGDYLTGTSYAGTLDLIALDAAGNYWLLDHKTGKGVYPDMALQLAAYADAENIVIAPKLGDGTATNVPVDMPMPHIHHLGVLHIRPDGTTLHEVENPESARERWLLLRQWETVEAAQFRERV